jgi:hypothetical protein
MKTKLPIYADYTLLSSVVQGLCTSRQHFPKSVNFRAFPQKPRTVTQSEPATEQAYLNLLLRNHFSPLPDHTILGFAIPTGRNSTLISGGLFLTRKGTLAGRFGGHSRVRMAATFVPPCPPRTFVASQISFPASESSARVGQIKNGAPSDAIALNVMKMKTPVKLAITAVLLTALLDMWRGFPWISRLIATSLGKDNRMQ